MLSGVNIAIIHNPYSLCFIMQDMLKHTQQEHPDYVPLTQALAQMKEVR